MTSNISSSYGTETESDINLFDDSDSLLALLILNKPHSPTKSELPRKYNVLTNLPYVGNQYEMNFLSIASIT